MRYDLALIEEFSREMVLEIASRTSDELALDLGGGAILIFQNLPGEDDCLLGFRGSYWHVHGDLMLSRQDREYVEMNALDVISSLCSGDLLIYETLKGGSAVDRSLIYHDHPETFSKLPTDLEIRIRRARCSAS